MTRSRRTFLKTASLAVPAGLAAPRRAGAAEPPPRPSAGDLPRGLTLATIRRQGETGLAVKTERGLLDVRVAERVFRQNAPVTIDEVFERGGGSELHRLIERAGKETGFHVDEATAEFGPCVTRPEKIVCVGLNYRKHAAETGQPVPKQPILFNKFNNALNAHRGTIRVSQEPAEHFDYEVELVIVIGRTARKVSEADALAHVFGYCTGNDFTARDLQRVSSQWMLGKTLDGSAPIGPYLVTADLLGDPNRLKLECRVNGQVRQSSSTADMVFDCASLVSYVSRHFTLRPGDLIFTGTPEGVIAGYPKEKQVWLAPGDQVACSIEKLSELQFTLA
jgi:2-keto-4-pentenoate hydratase/2-oxohepta-3-ene-1,7-dioic acid hydratase in catechol pathway